ncbi:MAG: hotdog fold thioesterase, partial [Bacteroidota bacterium]
PHPHPPLPEGVKQILKNVLAQMLPGHKLLGITLKEIEQGRAVLSMPYRPDLIGDPRSQRLHGGIIAALLDSAGGAAAITTLTSPEDMVSSIDIRVDYLEPGKPKDVLAEAVIIRSGSAILVTNMKAWHPETGEVICEGRGVYRVKRMKDIRPLRAADVDTEALI